MQILDCKYNNITINEALGQSLELLQIQSKSKIFFLNADCIYKAQHDIEYRNILNSAELILPDGIGVKLITRLFGWRMKDNCNGTDFSPLFMAKAAQHNYKIFFLGAKEGIAEKAAHNVSKHVPAIQIVGAQSGYFANNEAVIEKINSSKADILFVAMGVPLQEKWIYKNLDKLDVRLCLGVGALFDYLSGTLPRAPKFMRIIHLEWLWRISLEPKRMFRRYIIDGSKLFWLILKQKLKS